MMYNPFHTAQARNFELFLKKNLKKHKRPAASPQYILWLYHGGFDPEPAGLPGAAAGALTGGGL
jgi:hypothetical protein